MSILSTMRDTAAMLGLDRALQALRDQQLHRMLEGNPLTEEELRAGAQEAVLVVARRMYCDETARALSIASANGKVDHRKQYAERATAAADTATLLSHQHLCRIPIVGDPDYAPR